MNTQTFKVPAMFYDDHCDRGLVAPELVRRVGRSVEVLADEDGISELFNDAEFYADPWGPDELPPGLRASAKRTVKAIEKFQFRFRA